MLEFPKHRAEDVQKYSKNKWWLGFTMGDILDHTTDAFPNKEALVDDKVRLTNSELRKKVD